VGETKLNTDGAFLASTTQAGAGVIARRCDGSIIFAPCRSLSQCASVLEAELIACIDGVRFAKDMGVQRVTVETDCQELVRMATSTSKDGSALGHLVEDLRVLT
jgi:ribonuclease HI